MHRVSLLLALLAAFALGGRTTAQDATPGAAAGDLPVTPAPAECTVEAPTID